MVKINDYFYFRDTICITFFICSSFYLLLFKFSLRKVEGDYENRMRITWVMFLELWGQKVEGNDLFVRILQ